MFTSCVLAESSIAMYSGRIEKWILFLPHQLRNFDFLIIAPKRSIFYLSQSLQKSSSDTPTNRHCYISSIVALFTHSSESIKHLPDTDSLLKEWISLQKDNTKVITIRRLQNKPTEAQEIKGVNLVTWRNIITTRDTLKRGSSEHLLLSFYTYIYPLRADLFSTQIMQSIQKSSIPKSTIINYIIYSDNISSLYIYNFKTAKKYKSIIYDPIPLELHNILKESLTMNPREYLFVDSRGEPFSRDSFSKWSNRILSKLFKTAISLSTLRHLFISTLDFNMPTQTLQEIGNKMGHSLSMQKLYQWKS